MFAFTDEFFPFRIFTFLVVAFSCSFRGFFNICYKACLVVLNSFSFCLSVKLCFSIQSEQEPC